MWLLKTWDVFKPVETMGTIRSRIDTDGITMWNTFNGNHCNGIIVTLWNSLTVCDIQIITCIDITCWIFIIGGYWLIAITSNIKYHLDRNIVILIGKRLIGITVTP